MKNNEQKNELKRSNNSKNVKIQKKHTSTQKPKNKTNNKSNTDKSKNNLEIQNKQTGLQKTKHKNTKNLFSQLYEKISPEKFRKKNCDQFGFNQEGIHRITKSEYDKNGFNKDGYNIDGYGRDGFDKKGFNKKGFNKKGFDKEGFDDSGYNSRGYNRNGYTRDGYDRSGYNSQGRNAKGYDRSGYNSQGYDKNGYTKDENTIINSLQDIVDHYHEISYERRLAKELIDLFGKMVKLRERKNKGIIEIDSKKRSLESFGMEIQEKILKNSIEFQRRLDIVNSFVSKANNSRYLITYALNRYDAHSSKNRLEEFHREINHENELLRERYTYKLNEFNKYVDSISKIEDEENDIRYKIYTLLKQI